MSTDIDGNPVYQIRNSGNNARAIGIPYEFAQLIPEGTRFVFKPTEQGFQYILIKEELEGLPKWVTELREA